MRASLTVAVAIFSCILVVLGAFFWVSRPRVKLLPPGLLSEQKDQPAKRHYQAAIVTTALPGQTAWSEYGVPVLHEYCKKQGYDLLVFRQAPERHCFLVLHCLQTVLQEAKYEYVVFVHHTVLLSSTASLDPLFHRLFGTEPAMSLAFPEDCFFAYACSNLKQASWQDPSLNGLVVVARRNALELIQSLTTFCQKSMSLAAAATSLKREYPGSITYIGHNILRQSAGIATLSNTSEPVLGTVCPGASQMQAAFSKLANRYQCVPFAELCPASSMNEPQPVLFTDTTK